MCGLVAILTKRPSFGFSREELDVFTTLTFIDTLRGEDSTGVFGVDNRGNVSIAKSAESAQSFLATEEFKKIDRTMFSRGLALVAHNRKATRGSITDANAHPFWVNDEVVLVHNGTFFGEHKSLANVEVDSHALAHTIANHEPDDLDGVFSKINAAYATIWYDVRDKSINFLRNSQRPLYFTQSASCWYICSEKEMLEFALKRHRVTAPKDGFEYFQLKENTVQKVTVKDNALVTKQITISGYKYTQSKSTKEVVEKDLEDSLEAYYAALSDRTKQHCAWTEHVEPAPAAKTTVLKLIHETKTEDVVEKRRESISEFTNCIIADMPEGSFNLMNYQKYQHIREIFPAGSSCYFVPTNIVPFDKGRYILYGRLTTQDAAIGFALVEEADFTKLINTTKQVELFGK
ncbi:MAG TPA: class II glutamine amidotransferase, partial [Methanosarcina sp.]|nr:class II glutamine amidotransferase [Methanosarcina sp.]